MLLGFGTPDIGAPGEGPGDALSYPPSAAAVATVNLPLIVSEASSRGATAEATAFANAPIGNVGPTVEPQQAAAAATVNLPASAVGLLYRAGNRQLIEAIVPVPGDVAPGEQPPAETLILPPRAAALLTPPVPGTGVNYQVRNRWIIGATIAVPGELAPGEAPIDETYDTTIAATARANVPFVLARRRQPHATLTVS